MLLSDCRLADADDVKIQRGHLQVVPHRPSAENSGLVALDVRRGYEQPENVSILARVRNFGTTKVSRDVSLYIDDQMKSVRTIELAPLGPADSSERNARRERISVPKRAKRRCLSSCRCPPRRRSSCGSRATMY